MQLESWAQRGFQPVPGFFMNKGTVEGRGGKQFWKGHSGSLRERNRQLKGRMKRAVEKMGNGYLKGGQNVEKRRKRPVERRGKRASVSRGKRAFVSRGKRAVERRKWVGETQLAGVGGKGIFDAGNYRAFMVFSVFPGALGRELLKVYGQYSFMRGASGNRKFRLCMSPLWTQISTADSKKNGITRPRL